MKVTILHADHGISGGQQKHINTALLGQPDGFFIRQIEIPESLGTVPCGIWGPSMGDDPVLDSECIMTCRGDRPYEDRMVNRAHRPVSYVQVIGIKEEDGMTLFTVYGGPLAPQHPEDETNQDPEASKLFWSQHALSVHDG